MASQVTLNHLFKVRILARQQIMEKISISRKTLEIGGGSITTPVPFCMGEILSRVYPHLGSSDQEHKGNMKVITTDGTFNDGGNAGHTGTAKCVLPGCSVTIDITAVFSEK
jgi:hypothetical protein